MNFPSKALYLAVLTWTCACGGAGKSPTGTEGRVRNFEDSLAGKPREQFAGEITVEGGTTYLSVCSGPRVRLSGPRVPDVQLRIRRINDSLPEEVIYGRVEGVAVMDTTSGNGIVVSMTAIKELEVGKKCDFDFSGMYYVTDSAANLGAPSGKLSVLPTGEYTVYLEFANGPAIEQTGKWTYSDAVLSIEVKGRRLNFKADTQRGQLIQLEPLTWSPITFQR